MALPQTVQAMVYLNLPFLEHNTDNEDAIELLKQIYFELIQPCTGKESPDLEDESTYTLLQKSFVADLVSMAMLLQKSVAISTGSDTSTSTQQVAKYLKKTKAGSVEAEFDLVNKNNFNISNDYKGLYGTFLDQAKMKAAQLGCSVLDILLGVINQPFIIPPFFVIKDRNRGCC